MEIPPGCLFRVGGIDKILKCVTILRRVSGGGSGVSYEENNDFVSLSFFFVSWVLLNLVGFSDLSDKNP